MILREVRNCSKPQVQVLCHRMPLAASELSETIATRLAVCIGISMLNLASLQVRSCAGSVRPDDPEPLASCGTSQVAVFSLLLICRYAYICLDGKIMLTQGFTRHQFTDRGDRHFWGSLSRYCLFQPTECIDLELICGPGAVVCMIQHPFKHDSPSSKKYGPRMMPN